MDVCKVKPYTHLIANPVVISFISVIVNDEFLSSFTHIGVVFGSSLVIRNIDKIVEVVRVSKNVVRV
jgi:hypothetical protein